jgi:hypothetical protein
MHKDVQSKYGVFTVLLDTIAFRARDASRGKEPSFIMVKKWIHQT